MAHDGIFATSDEILVKAGDNVSTAVTTEARINTLCLQIESVINGICRFNFSDAYATLNKDTRGLLSEIESNMVAIYLISYKFSGEDGEKIRTEGENQINILRDGALRDLSILKDKKVQDFINAS